MADQQDPQKENAQESTPQQPVEAQSEAPAEQTQPPQAEGSQEAPMEPVEAPAEEAAAPQSPEEKKMEAPEVLKKAKDQPATKPDERIWALVAYLPMVSLIALIMKPDSDFVKLHGRQGLLIFIFFFFNIFIYLVPFIGPVIGIIVHFGCIGIGLFSMYQSFIGNWWKIPVLGDVAAMLPVEAFTKVTRTAVMTEKVDEEKRAEEKEGEKKEEQPAQEQPEQTAPAETQEGSSPGEPPAEDSGADQQS